MFRRRKNRKTVNEIDVKQFNSLVDSNDNVDQ